MERRGFPSGEAMRAPDGIFTAGSHLEENINGDIGTSSTENPVFTHVPSPIGTLPRILCLHGFRQTSQNFRGRTSALRKRLKHSAEFIFIDAPHALPTIHQNKAIRDDTIPALESTVLSTDRDSEVKRCRRGWLVTPEQYRQTNAVHFQDIDDQQYQKQTAGWEESLEVLENILANDDGLSFDGVLGFSQGAAVAAVLAALECQRPVESRRFNFVILCSGYISALPDHRELLQNWQAAGGIPLPSMHVFGAGQQDRQVGESDSEDLMQCFKTELVRVLRHEAGHLIPATRQATAQMAEFIASVCNTAT